jgi:hypothetical protein
MTTNIQNHSIDLKAVTNLRIIAVIISLLLSILAVITDDVINSDGVLYVEMAEAFLEGGLAGAANLYNWPLYSVLAAIISQITTLSILHSFYVLNALLFTLVVDACICLCSQRITQYRQLIIASIVLLCFYSVNEYRDYIIRDAGYWALSLYSIYHFLAYSKSNKLVHLIWWQILLISATLFRIEGIVLLALMPFILLIDRQNTARAKSFIASYIWVIALVIIGAALYFTNPSISAAFSKISELNGYMNWDKYADFITHGANVIDHRVINPRATSEGYGLIVLLTGFLGVTLAQTLQAYSVSATLLTFMSAKNINETLSKQDNRIWAFIIVAQLAVLYAFFLATQLLTTRYCILTALLVLLWFMPTITEYISQSLQKKKKTSLFFLTLILLYSAVDAFHHSGSKTYIIEDSMEAAQQIGPEDDVFTNNRLLGFYLTQAKPKLKTDFKRHLEGIVQYDYAYIEPHRLPENQISKLSTGWILISSYGTEKRPILLYKNPQSK